MADESIWVKIRNTIEGIAPTIANAILPGSGIAINLLSSALTGKPDSSPESVLAAAQDPDAAIKLKQVEDNFIISQQMLKDQLDELKITAPLQDTANARQREIDLSQSGHPDNTQKVLAYMTFAGFFIILFCILFVPVQQSMKDVAVAMLGALGGAFVTMMGYYFGSSIGSKSKEATLAGSSIKDKS